jgi:hypothetical protein
LTLVYGIIVISFSLKLLNTSFILTQFYAWGICSQLS